MLWIEVKLIRKNTHIIINGIKCLQEFCGVVFGYDRLCSFAPIQVLSD
jgi:hypothetical protein